MFCRGWHVMARVRARCSSKERLPAFCSGLRPTCSWGNEMVGCGCKTAWIKVCRRESGLRSRDAKGTGPGSTLPSHQRNLEPVNVGPPRGFGARPQRCSVTLALRQDTTLWDLSGRAGETSRAFDFIVGGVRVSARIGHPKASGPPAGGYRQIGFCASSSAHVASRPRGSVGPGRSAPPSRVSSSALPAKDDEGRSPGEPRGMSNRPKQLRHGPGGLVCTEHLCRETSRSLATANMQSPVSRIGWRQ
jgi:hypothetical protein